MRCVGREIHCAEAFARGQSLRQTLAGTVDARSLLKSRVDQPDLRFFTAPVGPRTLSSRSHALSSNSFNGSVAQGSSLAMQQPLDTVFVYGTLLAEEVTKLVLDRVPTTETGSAHVRFIDDEHQSFEPALEPRILHAATLKGHQRYSIKGRMYPALAHATQEESIQGKVHKCMMQQVTCRTAS